MADYLFSFEKLDVWKNSRLLVSQIYTITNDFPSNELYGLVSQLRRAAVSVSSNNAEGTARVSLKEQSRFLEIAFSSLMEVYCQLQLSVDLHFLKNDEFESLKSLLMYISNQINALRNSVNRRITEV